MKCYMVGGAVRDDALGRPITERDWVVVGSTPQDMLAKGFTPVGKDFPVFLHPDTKDEYALARTERKVSPGYKGFECDASRTVTLEEDLGRRDLTINAMAQDETGQLIDPYHGMADLKAKCLRHVSPAFVEDPVRVLRVARFMARFQHLGFTVADETRQLMSQMVRHGELAHLVPERTWQEWLKSLQEDNPEQFILTLRHCGALGVVFPEIDALFGVPDLDSAITDVGIQLLATLQHVTTLTDDPVLPFSVLALPLGKALTPVSQWPHHPDYTAHTVTCLNRLCERLRIPTRYRKMAQAFAKSYAHIRALYQLSPLDIVNTLEAANVFRTPDLWDNLLLMAKAVDEQLDDALIKHWQELFHAIAAIRVNDLKDKGHDGKTIQSILRSRREACARSRMIWEPHET